MGDNLNNLLSKTGDVALRRRALWLMENFELKDGLKVLDVGCGDGFYLHLLTHLNYQNLHLTGIDNSNASLVSARRNLTGKNVKLIYSDAQKLPFRANTFDRIIASEVLEHVENDGNAVSEINRVLKPGGIFVCSVPNVDYPFLWDPVNSILQRYLKSHIRSGFWAGIWNQHIRLYSQKHLKELLSDAGLKNVNIKGLTHYCLPFNHYLINLVARFISNKNKNSGIKKALNKFSRTDKTSVLFKLLFLLDKRNLNWNKIGSTVSLVAYAEK